MNDSIAQSDLTETPTLALPGRAPPNEQPPHIPNYRLLKRIGRGAFGTVWLAEESATPHYCAVKVLDAPTRNKADRSALAERELAGVNAYRDCAKGHPHLIQIHATGLCTLSPWERDGVRAESSCDTEGSCEIESSCETDRSCENPFSHAPPGGIPSPPLPPSSPKPQSSTTTVYYVMEIADHAHGPQPSPACQYEPLTLKRLIRRKERLTVDEALDYARQLLDAIEHLHKLGIQHRDVKPDNCLFVGGVLKLADVGLVSSDAVESVGSPGYVPPEGAPDDVYALGKVLYEMVTGLAAERFPEWPGDLGPSKEVHLSRLREVVNRLCHPHSDQRNTEKSVLRHEIENVQSHRSKPTISRRRAMAFMCIFSLVAFIAGIVSFREWLKATDPYERRYARPPYNGAEGQAMAQLGDHIVALTRMHRQDEEFTLSGRVRFFDLQTRLNDEKRTLVINGAYQIYSAENPVTGDVLDPRGEIIQLLLNSGDTFLLLHHAQSLPWPGIRGRFARNLPIQPFLDGFPKATEVRLVAVPAVTPEEAISWCRAYPKDMKENSIRIANLGFVEKPPQSLGRSESQPSTERLPTEEADTSSRTLP